MRRDVRSRAHALLDLLLDEIEATRVPEAGEEVFRSNGPLPPATSRETFNRRAPAIEGARKVAGRGRGYWEVPRSTWFASFRKQPAALRIVPPTPPSEAERASEMLANAGFRKTAAAR